MLTVGGEANGRIDEAGWADGTVKKEDRVYEGREKQKDVERIRGKNEFTGKSKRKMTWRYWVKRECLEL